MATTSTFSAAMKTKFIGPIRDNISSNKVLLFGTRTRNGDEGTPDPQGSRDFRGIQPMADGIDFVGNEFRIPLRSSRNQGTGPRAENVPLPAAGNQGYKYITEPLRYYYGVFNITGQLLKASESQEGAFKRALTEEMKGVTDDLKRHTNIHAYGDATGVVATVPSGANSATQTVASTIYLQPGDIVDIYQSDISTYVGSAARTILSVNRSTLAVVLDASVNVPSGAVFIKASSDSTSSVPNNDRNQAINGLSKIIDSTGALHGVNPATAGEAFWSSTEQAASSAVIGDNLLRQLVDGVGYESGSDEELILITTRGVRNRYANTLTSFKRFNDDKSTTLRGGFKALLFDDMPMVYDDHCQLGTVYAVNTDAMFWSQMSDWEWMEEDGEVLKQVPGYDKYVAYLFKYCQLGTWARNRHGKLTGGADDTK